MNKERENLSKFISLILRHKPETIGISLDTYGWANVDELLDGINSSNNHKIDREILEDIVNNDSKQRYSFNENKTKIRANQGHSIKVDVELKEVIPPDILYHGTATRFINSIELSGLKSMSRLHVHLSKDYETAINVGKRHGEPIVLEIDAKRMHDDNYKFYLSDNGVYLTEFIPTNYIKFKVWEN